MEAWAISRHLVSVDRFMEPMHTPAWLGLWFRLAQNLYEVNPGEQAEPPLFGFCGGNVALVFSLQHGQC